MSRYQALIDASEYASTRVVVPTSVRKAREAAAIERKTPKRPSPQGKPKRSAGKDKD